MTITASPDLVTTTSLSRTLARANQDLAIAGKELSTGLFDDPVAASGGDAARLYAIERDIAFLDGRSTNLKLAGLRAEASQNAIARVEAALTPAGASLAAAVGIGDVGGATTIAKGGRDAFAEAVAALNTRFGERSLFAGAAVDQAALAPAADILADIATAVAAAPDAATAIAAVDDYFTSPAGFAATGYLGDAADVASVELADGVRVDYALKGDDASFRDALAALALTVIGAEGGFAGATDRERLAVLDEASQRGLNVVADVITLRGDLGVTEARIEEASIRIAGETSILEQARNKFVAKDQFVAASEFAALEAQLQAVFSVTARLSSLSLTSFLR